MVYILMMRCLILRMKKDISFKNARGKKGRAKMDSFLKNYFDDHKFQTITTEEFLAYLDQNLLQGKRRSHDQPMGLSIWIACKLSKSIV